MKKSWLLVILTIICLAGGCAERTEERMKDGSVTDPAGWPIFRGDNRLSGNTTMTIPDKLSLLWSFQSAEAIKSSPVIGMSMVFIGSDDGSVYALSLERGEQKWQFRTEGAVEAAPLLLDSVIYVGSVSGYFYALNAGDGRLIWQYETEGQIHGSANWTFGPDRSEKWLMVGSYDNRLYCLSAKTGRLNWIYETDYFINGTPATDGEHAVFGGCDEMIHIVSVLSGKKIAGVESGAYIAGSAAMAGENVYLGHYGDRLICVDVPGKKISWEYGDKKTGAFFSSPAVSERFVIIGARDKNLHCVDRDDGKKIWLFRTRGDVDSSPVIAGKRVICASKDGWLYLVDLEQGSEIDAYEIGAPISGSPAVAAGKIVIGAEDGRVYAFGENK